MASALNVIKNFMSSLNNTKYSGTGALSEAVAAVSNFRNWSELIETMISDCKKYGGNSFLQRMCGINLSNKDTGAITGSDAGGGSTKTAESIVPESGSWKYPSKTTFKVQGLTVTVPKKSTLNSKQQYIVGGLYTWWIKDSLTLIQNSFGLSFTDSGASVKKIDVSFYDKSDGKVAYVTYDSLKKTQTLHMRINMHFFNNIDQTNPNGVGSSETLTYLDRTIAHEMVHAVMAANVDYFSKLPVTFKEGAAELVHGIDDKRTDLIKSLANDPTKLKSALNSSGTAAYAAGYILLRYLAKQSSVNRKPSPSSMIAENNFSESIAADELFQSTENFSELDEIISKENSVAENFAEPDENIFSLENSQVCYGGENQ